MTWPFENDTSASVKMLAKQSYRQNKMRNHIAVLAIFLTTLLICTIFLIGGSYINSLELQQQQLRGTTGHAKLNAPLEDQYKYLLSDSQIDDVGIRTDVIQPSFANLSFDVPGENLFYGFRLYDTTEWEKHRSPVLNNINGNYPNGVDEMMVPVWVLEKWGITDPYIGMELPFTYRQGTSQEQHDKIFHLSGWFNEYDYISDASIAYLLVSQSFCDEIGFDIWDNRETTIDISFTNTDHITEATANIEINLNLRSGQILSVNPDLLGENAAFQTIALCILLGLGIVLCGYLLIYNVFYISVSNDVRFYGQLRTIGTTAKQIGRVISKQAMRMAFWGIGAGLLCGFLLSYAIIPGALQTLTEVGSGIVVAQNPLIYLATATFSLATVVLSIRKPIRIAKQVSPISALFYQNESIKIKPVIKSRRFSALGMALRNIKRTMKKSVLTIFSIFLGITSCLIIMLLIQSMSTDGFVSSTMEHDIELANQTLALGYDGGGKQLFNQDFIDRLNKMEGISQICTQKEQPVIPIYNKELYYPYILDKYQSQGMEAPDKNYYEQHPNRFYTQIVSINAETVKAYLKENGFNYDAFYNGECALLVTDKPELLPDDMILQLQCGQIKQYEAIPDGNTFTLPIGGFLPSSYYGGLSTDAPYIFVSDTGMEEIAPNAYITSVGIDVGTGNKQQVNSTVQELCNQIGEISITSKADLIEGLHSAKMTLYIIGGGIALVLAFIGIVNFANIMFTNIETRKYELSVMESIGMTKKQCRQMLQMEGFLYAAISLVLCLSIGNLLLLVVYQVFKGAVDYATFHYPIGALFVISAFLVAFCWFIPQIFTSHAMKKAVVERLRE